MHMPTYEYKCDACGHAFEKFQSIKADPIKVCPTCGQERVRRLIGMGGGLIFKGSGFYITDYRDKGYADKAKAESGGGEAKPDDKGDAKSDKPADGKGGDGKAAEAKPAADAKPAESKPATPTPTPTPSAGKSES